MRFGTQNAPCWSTVMSENAKKNQLCSEFRFDFVQHSEIADNRSSGCLFAALDFYTLRWKMMLSSVNTSLLHFEKGFSFFYLKG